MAITQTSKIQIRTGNLADLPQLAVGEMAYAVDEQKLFIGNESTTSWLAPTNTEILTVYSNLPASGIDQDVLFNDSGIITGATSKNANATFTYDYNGGGDGNGLLTVNNIQVINNSNLGDPSNITITGGGSGQVLSTDGTGVLSWITVSGGGSSTDITNGTSNVSIPVAGGNVNTSVGGVANVLVVTPTGANVTGTFNATGDMFASNLTLSGNLTLPAGSTLDTDDIDATGNVIATGNITGGNLSTSGNVGAGNLSVTGNSNLGSVSNITITGGTSGQVLTTNGSGVLSWSTVGSGGISNGTSGVAVPTVDSNVVVTVGGTSTWSFDTTGNLTLPTTTSSINYSNGTSVFAGITSNSSNFAGNVTGNAQPNITSVGTLTSLAVSGNITGGNIATGGQVVATGNITGGNIATAGTVTGSQLISNVATGTAPLIVTSTTLVANLNAATAASALTAGTVTVNAQPNITGVGTLTGLTSGGVINFTSSSNVSLGPVANVKITGGTSGQVLTTDGSGTLSWSSVDSTRIANGTSNVSIPTSGGNVNTSVGGVANVLVVTSTGANVSGTMRVTGDVTFGSAYTESIFTISSTTPQLNPNNGTIQTWNLTGASTPTASTSWLSGQSVTLMIDDGSSSQIDWTSVPVIWETNGGVAPTLSTNSLTVITLWKVGTLIYGARVGDS